jgi:hypothetical protein
MRMSMTKMILWVIVIISIIFYLSTFTTNTYPSWLNSDYLGLILIAFVFLSIPTIIS